jgi:membrane protease YdiL (CAAX protease family)
MAQPGSKKLVLSFVLLVLLTSWSYEAFIIFGGGVARFGLAGLVILMWIPGLLSILLRLALGLGFEDVRFIVGRPRYYGYAVLMPLVLALITGLMCVILDVRRFASIESHALREMMLVALSVLAFGLFGALGEELGWRGFLLPRMIAGDVPHPYLASGIVWAVWHLPLIAFGGFYQTSNTFLMVLAYAMSIVAMNFVISELRVRSGSVWVATLLHASHNFFFQLAVPVFVLARPGARSELWEVLGGDSGIIVAVLYAITFLSLFGPSSNTSKGSN